MLFGLPKLATCAGHVDGTVAVAVAVVVSFACCSIVPANIKR